MPRLERRVRRLLGARLIGRDDARSEPHPSSPARIAPFPTPGLVDIILPRIKYMVRCRFFFGCPVVAGAVVFTVLHILHEARRFLRVLRGFEPRDLAFQAQDEIIARINVYR